MSERRVGVLFTCVGGALSGSVIAAMREQAALPVRIVGVECRERPALDGLDAAYQVPAGTDPSYVGCLMEICRLEGVQVVIPGADEEVEALAAGREALVREGIACPIPALATVQLLRHKARVLQRLVEARVSVAPWSEVRTREDLQATAARLGYPARPFVLKPCMARGGRGMFVIDERRDSLTALLTDREHLRMRLRDVAALLPPSGLATSLLAMAYLHGPAYDVDVLARRGEVICLAIRRRYNPRGIPFEGCVTEADEALDRKVRAISAALELDGCADIDLARDEQGEAHVLEVNPRLSGSVIGAIRAGMNLPLEAIRMALGLPVVPAVCPPGIETVPELSVKTRVLTDGPMCGVSP